MDYEKLWTELKSRMTEDCYPTWVFTMMKDMELNQIQSTRP